MLSHFSRVWLFVTPWTVAWQLLCPWDSPGKNTGVGCHCLFQGILGTVACKAPLSMGFSRQEYWSALPYPPPGDPDPCLYVLCIERQVFTTSVTWQALRGIRCKIMFGNHCSEVYHSKMWYFWLFKNALVLLLSPPTSRLPPCLPHDYHHQQRVEMREGSSTAQHSACALIRVWFCNHMDCSPPGSLSMGFPRQEYWSGLPSPSPKDLPQPGMEPTSLTSPTLAGRFLPTASPEMGESALVKV